MSASGYRVRVAINIALQGPILPVPSLATVKLLIPVKVAKTLRPVEELDIEATVVPTWVPLDLNNFKLVTEPVAAADVPEIVSVTMILVTLIAFEDRRSI